MKDASDGHQRNWNSNCERYHRGEDCALPTDVAKLSLMQFNSEKEECKIRFDAALK